MDIEEIKQALDNSDPQLRMRGIRELRQYDAEIATPLLLNCINDQEFLVRSFVAMGLRQKRSPQGYEALLKMMQTDSDPNVRSEAANSLSYYGQDAIPHLRTMYEADSHWLVRRSILAALADSQAYPELLEVCELGLSGEDLPVIESCISCLGIFTNTPYETKAVELLLPLVTDESWRIRLQVAKALGKYQTESAIAASQQLKNDPDHRVVGAVLESLV